MLIDIILFAEFIPYNDIYSIILLIFNILKLNTFHYPWLYSI